MRLLFLLLLFIQFLLEFAHAERVVIFIPGWKGTELLDSETGNRVWVSAAEAVRNRSTLTLNNPDAGFYNKQTLIPNGILKGVSVIPDYLEVDAYGATIKALESACGASCKVKPLPYDWRLDLIEPIRLLDKAVNAEISAGNEVILVAHSMGGLIAAYYLRYGAVDLLDASENWSGAKLVKGVVFAGVPFRGALTIFNDMQNGIRTGLNRSLLSIEAVSSFPSSYYLLPHPDDVSVVTTNGEALPNPIYDLSFYVRTGWGASSSGNKERRETFLAKILARANRFSRLINADGSDQGLGFPCLNIFGSGHETIARAVSLSYEDSIENSLVFYKNQLPLWLQSEGSRLLSSPGDKVVTELSTSLPKGFVGALQCSNIQTKVAHHRLFLIREVQSELRELFGGVTTDEII